MSEYAKLFPPDIDPRNPKNFTRPPDLKAHKPLSPAKIKALQRKRRHANPYPPNADLRALGIED